MKTIPYILTTLIGLTLLVSIQSSVILGYKNTQQIKDLIKQVNLLEEELTNLQSETTLLKVNIEQTDHLVNKDVKHKQRANLIVAAVKKQLPLGSVCSELTSSELLRVANTVVDLSERYAVKASLILAVIRQESAFCKNAISPAGAQGYMQLMPYTAEEVSRQIGIKLHVWATRDNIHLGVAYLSTLLMTFQGNIDLAIKAYNAGPTHVKKVEANMMTLHPESADYVLKVKAYIKIFEESGINW